MGASVCPLASWSASLLLQPPHLLILTGLLVSYWETEPSHAAASSTEKRDGVRLLSEDKRLLSEAAAEEVLIRWRNFYFCFIFRTRLVEHWSTKPERRWDFCPWEYPKLTGTRREPRLGRQGEPGAWSGTWEAQAQKG